MTFEQMLDIYIEAFIEQGAEPGQGLVNRNKVRLLQNLKETLGGKVMSVDTLMTAIKEAKFQTDPELDVVAVDDLIWELEERGIKCK